MSLTSTSEQLSEDEHPEEQDQGEEDDGQDDGEEVDVSPSTTSTVVVTIGPTVLSLGGRDERHQGDDADQCEHGGAFEEDRRHG